MPIRQVVLSTGHGEAAKRTAARLVEHPGVRSVLADPVRGQVVVRYDHRSTQAGTLHAALVPEPPHDALRGWIATWPRLTRVLMVLIARVLC